MSAAYRIKIVLKKSIWFQGDLADAIGMGYSLMSMKLSGRRPFSTGEVVAIAKVLDVSTDYLLGVSNDPSPGKTIVTYVGIQETVHNKGDLILVNEPSGTTVVYNEDRHEAATAEDLVAINDAIKETQGKIYREVGKPKSDYRSKRGL